MSTRGPSIAPRTLPATSPVGAGSSPESAPSPGNVTSIVTSREWVLPPRPKPGRKPSIDTPASKRKAQNRAAQRAFRERRATRVQELEQKLLEVEKEKEVKEMGLVNTINKLKFENQFLIKSMESLRKDFNALRSSMGASPYPEKSPPLSLDNSSSKSISKTNQINFTSTSQSAVASIDAYRTELNQSAQHLLNFAKSSPANPSTNSPTSSSYSVQQISPAPSADSPGGPLSRPSLGSAKSQSKIGTQHTANKHKSSSNDDFDCGICMEEQCLCADVGLKSAKSLEERYNSFSPMPAVSIKEKRKRTETEIDFTTEFSQKKMPDLDRLRKKPTNKTTVKQEQAEATIQFNENSPLENCGFCSDDTPCVCREAAKEAARLNESLSQKSQLDEKELEEAKDDSTSLPPIQARTSMVRKSSLPVMHPGPTVEIREFTNLNQGSVHSVVAQDADTPRGKDESSAPEEKDKSGCTGNPGTCLQCQSDPMSTLFCSTVASKAAQESTRSSDSSSTPSSKGTDYFKGSSGTSVDSRKTSVSDFTNPSTPHPVTPSASSSGIFIPCADAYKTLSRHKSFNTVDFSSLVGRLTTRGMLVEVQSVANLIRELDKKVYD